MSKSTFSKIGYLLAIVMSLLCIYLAFSTPDDQQRLVNLFMNIGTEMLGSVIIFGIIDYNADITDAFDGLRNRFAAGITSVAEQIQTDLTFDDTIPKVPFSYLVIKVIPLNKKHQIDDIIVLRQTETLFGRSNNNDVVLGDDKSISALHFSIKIKQGEYYIIDNSTNGTYLNDTRLENQEPQRLEPNSTIKVAKKAYAIFEFKQDRKQELPIIDSSRV